MKFYTKGAFFKPFSMNRKASFIFLFVFIFHSCNILWARDVRKVLNKLRDPKQRADAMKEFAEIDSESLPDLRKYAFNEREDVHIRVPAISKIGTLKAKQHTKELELCLFNDKEKMCRAAAASSLAKINDPSSISILKKSMESDTDGTVQMYSALALAKMGNHSGKRNAVEILSGKDENCKLIAVQVLDEIGDKGVIPELQNILRNSTKPWTQIRAKQAIYSLEMKGLKEYELLSYLKDLLYKKDVYLMQKWVTSKIAAVGTKDAYDFLILLQNDPECPAKYALTKIIRKLKFEGKIY